MQPQTLTADFEALLLAAYVSKPEHFIRYGPILDYRFFSSSVSIISAKVILEYAVKYGRTPVWEVVTQLVEDDVAKTGTNPKEAREYITKLRGIDTSDIDYVTSRLIFFCKERATIGAVRQVVEMLKSGNSPESGFTHLFEDILKIGQDVDDLGYFFHADVKRVVDKITSRTFGVKTGFPQLDAIWRQGWCPGWLIVPLAPPKRYKTTFALNLALNMIGPAVGADVLYYTCEISQELAMQRAFCNVSKLTEEDLFDSPERFSEIVQAKINEYAAGNLLIKHYPLGTATIGQLKAHAKTAIQQFGLKPKAIVIDYADTVVASDTSQPEYKQQQNVYKEAIAFGASIGACVIMPDRCTRETVDQQVPSMSSFQGAFAKGGILDIAIGLCATDKEHRANVLRSFVFINRHGPQWQHFRGKIDPARSIIDMGTEIPYNPDEDQGNSKKGKFKKTSESNDFMPGDLQV